MTVINLAYCYVLRRPAPHEEWDPLYLTTAGWRSIDSMRKHCHRVLAYHSFSSAYAAYASLLVGARGDVKMARDVGLTSNELSLVEDSIVSDPIATPTSEKPDRTLPDRTLRELQTSLPWTAHYHRDFRATPMTHKDFSHALLHVLKAGGKLAGIVDEAEHAGYEWANPAKRAEVEKFVADLVICALRMATTCPDGQIDLQRAVENRLAAKNNQLATVAPALRAEERKP